MLNMLAAVLCKNVKFVKIREVISRTSNEK